MFRYILDCVLSPWTPVFFVLAAALLWIDVPGLCWRGDNSDSQGLVAVSFCCRRRSLIEPGNMFCCCFLRTDLPAMVGSFPYKQSSIKQIYDVLFILDYLLLIYSFYFFFSFLKALIITYHIQLLAINKLFWGIKNEADVPASGKTCVFFVFVCFFCSALLGKKSNFQFCCLHDKVVKFCMHSALELTYS